MSYRNITNNDTAAICVQEVFPLWITTKNNGYTSSCPRKSRKCTLYSYNIFYNYKINFTNQTNKINSNYYVTTLWCKVVLYSGSSGVSQYHYTTDDVIRSPSDEQSKMYSQVTVFRFSKNIVEGNVLRMASLSSRSESRRTPAHRRTLQDAAKWLQDARGQRSDHLN